MFDVCNGAFNQKNTHKKSTTIITTSLKAQARDVEEEDMKINDDFFYPRTLFEFLLASSSCSSLRINVMKLFKIYEISMETE